MSPQLRIMLVFFLQPVAFGAWLPRIPDVQAALGVGPATLALALLGMPAGILLTLPVAGGLVGRIGARRTIIWGFPVFLALVALPPLAPSVPLLFCALAVVGSALSVLELGLNVMADEIEKRSGRPIMSTCHGFWSLGIMAGSLVGAGLAGLALPPFPGVFGPALAVLPVALFLARGLPALPPAPAAAPAERPRLPGPALLGICLFTFGITMTEGAVADWSAVFLRETFAAPAGQAGLGYSLFALMVAAGRFGGDALKLRFGAVPLARACGLLAVAGVLALALAPSTPLALAAFAAIGLGASVGFPLAVTAAAGLGDRSAASNVATLSFVALIGFLVGPPLIGFVAEATGLRIGLAMLLPGLLVSLALAGRLGGGQAAPAARTAPEAA